MNKLFKYILEYYNDGSEKVDSSTELYKVCLLYTSDAADEL